MLHPLSYPGVGEGLDKAAKKTTPGLSCRGWQLHREICSRS